ncbi:MAG: nucleotide-binding protein [Burkholderiales bacterium]
MATTILVANPKGGSGKTTLSTNLAGYFAWLGEKVVLGDMDRQQSSLSWLNLRAAGLPAILAWDAREEEEIKLPHKTTWTVVDSPAGMHGKRLTQAVKLADKIIVPVQPSVFDMWATEEFIKSVLEEKSIRKNRTFLAIVGMRVDPRTRAAAMLEEFLGKFDLPVLTYLRDTQNYMNAAALGETLFDQSKTLRTEKDFDQWQPLLEWVAAEE